MTKNIGAVDRILRILVGLALIGWAIWGSSSWHLWGWIGIIPLVTAFMSWCPAYTILGIKTCPAPK